MSHGEATQAESSSQWRSLLKALGDQPARQGRGQTPKRRHQMRIEGHNGDSPR